MFSLKQMRVEGLNVFDIIIKTTNRGTIDEKTWDSGFNSA